MDVKDLFRERYKAGDTPWDLGEADFNLVEVVTGRPIEPCKALEIGCGTGDNSIWLAQNGFSVTATDASKIALDKARGKAEEAGVKIDFVQLDFIECEVPGAPFKFAFDRGFFHVFGSDDERSRFAKNVAAHLDDSGLWLTILGNADELRHGRPGPPQRTAGQIVSAIEPFFELLSLTSSHFGSKRPNPPRAWRCLMSKRVAG